MKSKYTFYILFLLLLLFYCGKNDSTYTIEIKDGVNYVHNNAPLWGDEPKVALEFVQKIGDLETMDENYQLYRPYDIAQDNSGNLYILDRGNNRIQKYDRNGKYLATIGRAGQGPGEFNNPVQLEMDSGENLYIRNILEFNIRVLTNAGKEIKRINLYDYLVTHTDNILTRTDLTKRLRSGISVEDIPLICLSDNDGNIIKEFGEVKDYGKIYLINDGNNIILTVDRDDNVYVAFCEQNRIDKYSPKGELIFRANRPLNYKLKYEMVTTTLPVEIKGSKSVTIPMFTKVSYNIGVDRLNRIWIQTYKKQKEKDDKPVDLFEFEIFDNDGILLGRLPIPQNFTKMRIFYDRLYLMDPMEEMCVYEYKIIDK